MCLDGARLQALRNRQTELLNQTLQFWLALGFKK
jgi:hypothetical protein